MTTSVAPGAVSCTATSAGAVSALGAAEMAETLRSMSNRHEWQD